MSSTKIKPVAVVSYKVVDKDGNVIKTVKNETVELKTQSKKQR